MGLIFFCLHLLNFKHFFFFCQGTPEFVAVSQCVHYFEWRTYVACKNKKFTPKKEVGSGHVIENRRKE